MEEFFKSLADKRNEVLVELILPIAMAIYFFRNISSQNSIPKNYNKNLMSSAINLDQFNFISIEKLYYSAGEKIKDVKSVKRYINYLSEIKKFEEINDFKNQNDSSLLLHFKETKQAFIDTKLSIKDFDKYEDYHKKYKGNSKSNILVSSIEPIYYHLYKKLFLNNDITSPSLVLDNFDLDFSKIISDSYLKFDFNVFSDFYKLAILILFLNSFQFMSEITEEKKNGLFENLKLMGATNIQILISHFINHFIVWATSFFIISIYMKTQLGIPVTAIFFVFLFSCLIITHFLVFCFLVSAIFKNVIICNIVTIASLTFSNLYTKKTISIYLLFPSYIFGLFTDILKNLSAIYSFKSDFFKIFFHRSLENEKLSIFLLTVIVILIVIFEFFLTVYILEVHPFQKGLRKPFFYFFDKKYLFGDKPIITESYEENSNKIEKVSSNSKPSIVLKNVDKTYYPKYFKYFTYYQVLKHFNFTIYKNQITVLLGHNGSGKSTLMNLVSGLLNKDSGLITVENEFVDNYSEEYKKKLSFCTQENIFYENLTIHQNLKIAAILKRMPFHNLNSIIEKLTDFFELKPKLNEFAGNLSGGMKRRLCLALSIIGYNEILLIDEATSGLDVATKRKVWEVLLQLRKHKTILLTTHFLEEADILGDRIAVMHEGKIKCCGSSMFLKKIFNVGYQLRVLTKNIIDPYSFLDFIKTFVPNSTYENQISNEYFFRLMSTENSFNLKMADFLDCLIQKENTDKYGIITYGLENTSLEDIFIKINSINQDLNESDQTKLDIDTSENHPFVDLIKISGLKLSFNQFLAVVIKKFNYAFSNLVFVIIPFIYFTLGVVALVFIVRKSIDSFMENKNFSISDFKLQNTYKDLIGVVINGDDSIFTSNNFMFIKNEFGLSLSEEKNISLKEIVLKKKEELGDSTLMEKFLIVIQQISSSKYIFYLNPYFGNQVQVGVIDFFYKTLAFSQNQSLNMNFEFNFIEASDSFYQSKVQKYTILFIILSFCIAAYTLLILCSPLIVYIVYLLKEKNSPSLQAQKIAGLSNFKFWIFNFVFDYFVILFFNFIGIVVVFICGKSDIIFYNLSNFILGICFCVLSALTIAYFFANLGLSKQTTELFLQLYLVILGLIPNMIYAITFAIYSSLPETISNSVEIRFNFFWLIISPVFNFFTVLADNSHYYLEDQCLLDLPDKIKECSSLGSMKFNIWTNILASLIMSLAVIFLTVILNKNIEFVIKIKEKLKKPSSNQDNYTENPFEARVLNTNYLSNIKEDQNVVEETKLVKRMCDSNEHDFSNNILIANSINKIYSNKQVVNNLSFTVKRNECLGLLGVNGAGKTTTFLILTGSIPSTSGQVYLNGYDLDNKKNFYTYLAYCPQENTGFDNISVEQNLMFHARISGIPKNRLKNVVKTLIEQCDLKDHIKKHAGKLSGGNKRKLSIAISLIGNKQLVLLDEPTTGVDAASRRHLWKTFSYFKKNFETSFILTSHSMDECQNLCERISIMVAGKFKCLGTFSYLRDKYAQGFTILIKIKDEKNNQTYFDEIKNKMDKVFKTKAELKEFYMNTIVFIIMSQEFEWSFLFRAMENLKNEFDFDDFMISGTNLEQIFLSFSN